MSLGELFDLALSANADTVKAAVFAMVKNELKNGKTVVHIAWDDVQTNIQHDVKENVIYAIAQEGCNVYVYNHGHKIEISRKAGTTTGTVSKQSVCSSSFD
jgi:hypothetical protein